jgi:hypothetical protein
VEAWPVDAGGELGKNAFTVWIPVNAVERNVNISTITANLDGFSVSVVPVLKILANLQKGIPCQRVPSISVQQLPQAVWPDVTDMLLKFFDTWPKVREIRLQPAL